MKPNIRMTKKNFIAIEQLVNSLDDMHFLEIEGLLDELDRATVEEEEFLPGVVMINSLVTFTVSTTYTDRDYKLKLILPSKENIQKEDLSVLTPVGSALLGLTIGDTISWLKPGGGELVIKILDVA